MRQLAFLTFISRSGSTFLAHLLNQYRDIAVSLEAGFLDGFLPPRPLRLDSPDAVPAFLDRLDTDERFSGWGVERDALARRLRQGRFPLSPSRLLGVVLDEAFQDNPAGIRVVKAGAFIWQAERIRRRFPGAKFIFIMRDPRAVFSSMKRTIFWKTGEPFATNPIRPALGFRRLTARLERYAGADWLYVVKYEDLVSDPERELSGLLAFLGAGPERSDDGSAYAERIPQIQKSLHVNVGGQARQDRIWGWRSELTELEILAVERTARGAMIPNGYEPILRRSLSGTEQLRMVWYWFTFLLERVANRLHRQF